MPPTSQVVVFSLRILEYCYFYSRTKYFSIMADEVTDSSNKEQFAICFRSVDDSFLHPNEDFIGFHHVESI